MRVPLTCCVLLAVWFNPSFSQRQQYAFEHLTVDDGLSQNGVNCIFQDSYGFLWFGTNDGLNKYDGYKFTVYNNNPLDPNSLSQNSITSICGSRKRAVLWIATKSGGVNRLDTRTGVFTHYRYDSTVTDGLASDVAETLLEDRNGTLWVGTSNGLSRFDEVRQRFTNYRHSSTDSNSLCSNLVVFLSEDRRGALWVGTFIGAVSRMERDASGRILFRNFIPPWAATSKPEGERVWWFSPSDASSSEGIFWMGTGTNGLRRFDTRTGERLHFRNDPAKPHSLPTNNVLFTNEDDRQTLWVGSEQGGLATLNRADHAKGVFNVYRHDPSDPSSLSNNNVTAVYQDRFGVLWAGTNGGGVNKLVTGTVRFKNFRRDLGGGNSLNDNGVWSIYEARDSTLWVGTTTALNVLDRRTGRWTNFKQQVSNRNAFRGRQVHAICEDKFRSNTFWLGTLDSGLIQFDRRTNRFKRHPMSSGPDHVYAIHQDREGILWLGTNSGGGLLAFHPSKKQFTSYEVQVREAPAKKGWVLAIAEPRDTSNHSLWLGTWAGGLYVFDRNNHTLQNFHHETSELKALAEHSVLGIYEDDQGALWLGTDGGGLKKYDIARGTVAHFTEHEGLANNVVYAILADNFNNLWLSTNKGLSKFNPTTHAFTNYDSNDGLQSNEFNLGASFESKSGELFFGGVNGLSSFTPTNEISSIPPTVLLTSLKTSRRVLPGHVLEDGNIDLARDESSFTIEFAVLHYKAPARNVCAYMLDGFDTEWLRNSKRHDASYSNLLPGEYTFRLKAANSDGVWSEPLVLPISILPPLWQRWWFLIITGALLIVLGWAFHRNRISRVLEIGRARVLEEQRIRGELKSDMHDSFAGVIAKMSGLASDLRGENDLSDEEKKERLERIAGYSDALLQSYSAIQWGYDQQKETLFDLMDQLKQYGEALFAKSGAKFSLESDMQSFIETKLPMEWRKELLLLFCEAMNNSAKHSNSCTTLTLSVEKNDDTIKICLYDNGDGFDENESGRKSGLLNMRKRAAKLNSNLDIQSENGRGVKICFSGKLDRRIV